MFGNFLSGRFKFAGSHAIMIPKISAILLPFIAIYWQDLDLVFREAFVNDFMNYTLIIPVVFGYIVYRKRHMLKAVTPRTDDEQEEHVWTSHIITGTWLLAISFLIYLLGSQTSYALEYHLLSMPLFAAGGIALVFNLQTLRTLLFPVGLLFFIQPYFVQLVNPFWSDLSWISSTTAYNILAAVNIPARFTTVLEVPTIEITTTSGEILPFTVGVASSGLNSMVGFTVFSIIVIYILREPVWKRITLMLLGYPLLLLLNTLRITIILSLAAEWSTAAAEIFHTTGGVVLIFIGTMLLLFIGEKVWKVKIYSAKPEATCVHCDESLKKGRSFCAGCGKILKSVPHLVNKQFLLKMSLLILAVSLFLLIQTPPIVLAKSPTQLDLTTISPEESKQLLPTIPGWNLEYLYRDSRVERILKQDASIAFAYIAPEASANGSYTYIFVGVQIATGRHTWESSLITWPAKYGRPTATTLDLRDVQILQDPTLTARFFAYQRPDSDLTEVVLYWFERVPFKISGVWEMRNVQISLWTSSYDLVRSGLISNQNDFAGVEAVYLPVAQSIANYWQPIKTSSLLTAILSQHGDNITLATAIVFVFTLFLISIDKRKQKNANFNAYQKLSKPDKQIIEVLRQTEKTAGTSTLSAITIAYKNIAGEDITDEKLLQKLTKAQEIGVIKSKIASRDDEPVQTWETQFPSEGVYTSLKTMIRAPWTRLRHLKRIF